MSKKLEELYEYKDCPFCGGEAELSEEPISYYEPSTFHMYCKSCMARGSYAFNPEEALANWNKRYIKRVK